MNRIVKNIISIVIIVAMGVLMYFTMTHIQKRSNDISHNEASVSTDSKQQTSSSQSGESKSQTAQSVTENRAQSDGDQVSPTYPTESSEPSHVQSIDEGAQYGESINSQDEAFNLMYYFIFAAEGLVLSLALVYLLMSSFGAKTFGELFSSANSIVIYLSTVVVLTSVVVLADKIITQKFFLTSSVAVEVSSAYENDKFKKAVDETEKAKKEVDREYEEAMKQVEEEKEKLRQLKKEANESKERAKAYEKRDTNSEAVQDKSDQYIHEQEANREKAVDKKAEAKAREEQEARLKELEPKKVEDFCYRYA